MFRDLWMRSAWKLSHDGDTSATVRRTDEDRGDNGWNCEGREGGILTAQTNVLSLYIILFRRDELAVNR